MKLLLPALAAVLFGAQAYAQTNLKTLPYPQTKKVDTVTTYFSTKVADPYRWLENDQAPETKAWVQEQNKVTQNYLAQIPYRDAIRKRIETLWNYEKYNAPFKEGKYTYFSKNTGLQSQFVLYRQLGDAAPEVFLDPNKFSKDGTTSLGGISFSKDGSLAAYQISEGGSDWRKVIVLKTTDKSIVGDTLRDVKFSGLAWRSNDGFYYSSYDKPKAGSQLAGLTQYHKLFYHKLGTPQSSDKLIFGGDKTPRRYIGAGLTEDERFLVITAANTTTGNELYVQDLSKANSAIAQVVSDEKNEHNVVDNVGGKLYIHTNLNAPNFRVVTVDAANPKTANWQDLIAENKNVLSVSTGGGKIFANYLKDATSLIEQYDMSGKKERSIELPAVGSAGGFGTKKEEKETYYTFTSYVYPPTIFKYDIATGKSTVYKKAGVQFDPTKYESKQVFYTSKDGTKVPMLITHKKGLVLNGKNPTLLYAYGGFGVNITPGFSTSNIVLLENGGIYAVPNLRGGGEYGETWHQAGTKLKKQNVFDDFIAAAEYLVKNNYTSKDYLAISGGSNGGLLVGATMAQRPDLCKVAFPAVGVMDMLRYNQFTAGAGWAYDYGTAQDSQEMFDYLYKYSPYHALKPAAYPATMVTTADHDDRVVPAHSFKFATRLQEMQKGPAPVLIRIETKAGHGAGRSTAQVISEQTDKWAFMFQNMGVPYSAASN
ncbi:prolyl oligopeptidase . Serine peptidase. MEROPS family S09A [Hymenobacter roseosalivarius DSM 11622]|uniref:prolyl oligopeptidase n=1 Tax=Hymenobacter roseosalivarius DSM 11622 TaxID=645990 RepID=A0A1W1V3T7_9BACT|nr:prolyl oligopeptidase family serine peptidase [Hymenobacter roseosalivarius]SMB87950.1 prolyl oligopeptidase . Serine peptidase. MEROPS family S09A [Hymenobacter roseosalivarius DSM 11622]